MDLKQRLLELLANLPSTDSPNERKALVLHTGLQYLAIYVDWQGSNVEFFTGFLDVLGQQDQPTTLRFLDALANSPQWISVDRKQVLVELRDEIAALSAEQWTQQLGTALQPAQAKERTIDTEMLAATVVRTVLVPYLAKGSGAFGEQVRERTDGATADKASDVAGQVWERVKQAFSDGTGTAIIAQFEQRTNLTADLLEALLKEKLDQDQGLAQALSILVMAPADGGKSAAQIIADTVGYVDAQGATISGGIVAGYIGNVTRAPSGEQA